MAIIEKDGILKFQKNWPTFSSVDIIYSKNPPSFNVDSLFWHSSFDIVILVYEEYCCFSMKDHVLFFNQMWHKDSKSTVTVPL